MSRLLSFAKGHGTRNDFVLYADRDGDADVTAAEVRFLCDRRAGIGGDGILRAVPARFIPGWDGDPELWFMDYRNADGSLAEMCGNGVRVFVRFLLREGLVPADSETVMIGTRAGVRTGTVLADGQVRVWMGRPVVGASGVQVSLAGSSWPATAIDVGNPHLVSLLPQECALTDLDLGSPPSWSPAERFPGGVNLEFVERLGLTDARMRVFERGVGETQSCGTGTVAVAMALRSGADGSYTIHVPGGTVVVDLADGESWLTGPAAIVADGVVTIPEEGDDPRSVDLP